MSLSGSMTFTLRGDKTLAEAEVRAHEIARDYCGDRDYTLEIHVEPSEYILSNSSYREAISHWEARVEVEIVGS